MLSTVGWCRRKVIRLAAIGISSPPAVNIARYECVSSVNVIAKSTSNTPCARGASIRMMGRTWIAEEKPAIVPEGINIVLPKNKTGQ
jgi:hypothetical protein